MLSKTFQPTPSRKAGVSGNLSRPDLELQALRHTTSCVALIAAYLRRARDNVGLRSPAPPKDYLAREGKARDVYPAEVNRWYAFLRESHEPVATLVEEANELATKHKLTLLRPLTATPLVLKRWDKELAAAEGQDQARKKCAALVVWHQESPWHCCGCLAFFSVATVLFKEKSERA